MSTPATLLLIDLSSIAVPIYKMSGSEADPDYTATQTVARVRSLAAGVDHVVVCCDSGRSFRHDVSEAYKAQRPQADAPMRHQIRLAQERLKADGFPVWSAKGFEADDVIASAAYLALADAERVVTVRIASADKDLLALVTDRCVIHSLRDGSTVDTAKVVEKFGVRPDQMTDYLCLVGDSSDNIAGAKGIGPKGAAKLLAQFGTLAELYRDLHGATDVALKALGLTPAIVASLRELEPRLDEVRQLVTLRTDVDVPLTEAWQPRTPTTTPTTDMDIPDTDTDIPDTNHTTVPNAAPTTAAQAAPSEPAQAPPAPAPAPARPADSMEIARPSVSAMAPREGVSFTHQLEPRTLQEAGQLAKWIFESKQFSSYGTAQAVLATILAGRELGLQAMASLRAIHIVDGKPTLSADLIRGLVIRSSAARYFRCVERTPERATFETQRGDDPPMVLTFTIEEGRAMWAKGDDAWNKSGWGKFPSDMLVARASAKLARLVYPELTFGLYTNDEIEDGRVA